MDNLCMGTDTLRSLLEGRDFPSIPPRGKISAKQGKEYADTYNDAAAAFLGPTIWEKTLSDFKLEYLDLDEFLGHNAPSEVASKSINNSENQSFEPVSNLLHLSPPRQNHLNMQGMDHCAQVHSPVKHAAAITPPMSPLKRCHSDDQSYHSDCKYSSPDLTMMDTSQDHDFNSCMSLPDEDLKPQPMTRKSKKHFVPENLKDDRYWARRLKNNLAAKRSREARRVKENQIVLRASYLEKENNMLKEDVMRLKAENDMLRNQVKKMKH